MDIRLLDLKRTQGALSDYLLILSANSQVHMKALRDTIEQSLEQLGASLLHQDGTKGSQWIALDYGGLLIHIFHEEAREFYSLERLWPEASAVRWNETHRRSRAKAIRKRN